MSRKYDVIAAGHLTIDIIPSFYDSGLSRIKDIMRPGKLVNVGDAKISTGGPVSNTGLGMKTLGNAVCFCARVGDDDLGRRIDPRTQHGAPVLLFRARDRTLGGMARRADHEGLSRASLRGHGFGERHVDRLQ